MKLKGNARKANAVFRKNHTLAKKLRTSDAGRDGILALVHHRLVGVRLLAATHSLFSSPDEAIAVLEDIQNDPRSFLHAVSAEHTLKAYREANLNLDW